MRLPTLRCGLRKEWRCVVEVEQHAKEEAGVGVRRAGQTEMYTVFSSVFFDLRAFLLRNLAQLLPVKGRLHRPNRIELPCSEYRRAHRS